MEKAFSGPDNYESGDLVMMVILLVIVPQLCSSDAVKRRGILR
jgi:hypothetical protein